MKLYKKISKVMVLMLVAIMICVSPVYTANAADSNTKDDYGVSPCYSYTSSITTGLSISGGDAICNTYVEGYYGSTSKITITQTLQRKSGSSWVDVWSWTNTEYYWYYSYTNYYYPLTYNEDDVHTEYERKFRNMGQPIHYLKAVKGNK